jgi:hypothetical protein
MKKITYSIASILLITAALSLSSCLKDSKWYVNVSQGKPLIELPLEARNLTGNLVTEALPISSTPQVIQVAVNLAYATTLSSPVTVTLALDPSAVATYNHANGLDTGGNVPYTLLPAADYSVPSYQVTIPAGQHLVYMNINVNTSLIDPSGLFILPIKIVDGGGQQISNYNELLLAVGAKNQYDATYTVKGFVFRNSASGPDMTLGGYFSGYTQALATVNANAVTWAPLWATGAAAGGLSGTTITVNTTSNQVTMASTGNTTLVNAPGYNNRYDPSTKTFYISYVWGTAPNNRAETDTLTTQ